MYFMLESMKRSETDGLFVEVSYYKEAKWNERIEISAGNEFTF